MAQLQLQPNFHEPDVRHRHAYTAGDRAYQLLVDGHQGLSDAQSEQLNARLVLLLANHVGDLQVLQQAVALARASVLGPEAPPSKEPA
jgi:hypothetical protein